MPARTLSGSLGRVKLEWKNAAIGMMLVPLFSPWLLIMANSQPAQAQTFQVLYNFTGGTDGANPYGITMDAGGKLYGTTNNGGDPNCSRGCGTVFTLAPTGSGWQFSSVYKFHSNAFYPVGGVTIGPDNKLYGMLTGGLSGCGIVYRLARSTGVIGGWIETFLYNFTGSGDGCNPTDKVIFDAAGHLYGVTTNGGSGWNGTVFMLTPSSGSWVESILQHFTGPNGSWPQSAPIQDALGNLYGTTSMGGNGGGVIYELSPSGSGWAETVLWRFQSFDPRGSNPWAGLVSGTSGQVYGVNSVAGGSNGGTAFGLMPSNGNWTFQLIFTFKVHQNGANPYGTLAMDAQGNLYGTTLNGGGGGTVFKLTPSVSGVWTETTLHDFTGTDGAQPRSGVILDTNGNLYGTTSNGGAYGYGVVFEITP